MVADFVNVSIKGWGVLVPFKQGLNSRLFQISRKNEGCFTEVNTNHNAVVVLVIKVLVSPAWVIVASPGQHRYLGISNRAVDRINRTIGQSVFVGEACDIRISDFSYHNISATCLGVCAYPIRVSRAGARKLAVVNVAHDAELFDYRSQCAGMVDVIVGYDNQIQGIV